MQLQSYVFPHREFVRPPLPAKLYRQANVSAHQEPITDVSAPTLTWHRSFLIGRRGPDEGRYGLDAVRDELDQLIERTFNLFPVEARLEVVAPSATKPLLFRKTLVCDQPEPRARPTWRLVEPPRNPSRRIELLDNEERTLVFTLGWAWLGATWDVTVRLQVRTNLFNVTCFATPRPSDEAPAPFFRIGTNDDFKRLTRDFWRTFHRFTVRNGRLARRLASPIFANVFADIRGVVVPCNCLEVDVPALPKDRELSDWAAWIVDDLRSIVTAPRRECAASYMIGGRALHLTALGPQPLDLRDQKTLPAHPVTFLLCVQTLDGHGQELVGARQLGRAVDRFHMVEMMRLAALIDLKELRDASVGLGQLDAVKERARRQLARYDKAEDGADLTREALEALRTALDAVSQQFFRENVAGIGLNFRIESARYYISQFECELAALRIGRVEGFQPYAQFVQRRLGVTFDFINRLGTRYERALRERTQIEQSFSAIQTRYTGTSVAEIQRDGEAILIAFLVPYYVIATVAHFFEAQEHREGLLAKLDTRLWGSGDRFEQLLYASIWAFCVIFAITRWIYSRASLKKDLPYVVMVWAAMYGICEYLLFRFL